MKKRSIPEIRELIYELTAESRKLARRQFIIANEIAELIEETKKRHYTRAEPSSRKVTAELAQSVRKMAAAYPDMSQQALAEAHGVNSGRISEILHGKR